MKIITTCDLSGAPEAVDALEKAGELAQLDNNRAHVLEAVADCDAYMSGAVVRVDKEFLDHAPNLKVIGSPSTGTDHLDLNLIKERGIILFHIAEEYDLIKTFTATSELAFALLLALIRKLPAALNDAKQGIWAREKYAGFQLYEKTLGILGLGRLGKISARIGQGFNMRVIANDRKDVAMDGVEIVSFDALLEQCDILTIHIHLTSENERLINAAALRKMKKGAILLNTSRGRVIDEQALIDALDSGHLAGAGLDVVDGEWLSPENLYKHSLIKYAREHNNLIISPHIGGATKESIYGARVFMAKKIANYIKENKIL